MAFHLLVPTTLFIAASPEASTTYAKAAQEWQKERLEELVTNETSGVEIKSGAFRRARVFEWKQNYSGVLLTAFVFPNKKKPSTPLFKSATLLRGPDCHAQGAVWEEDTSLLLPLKKNALSLAQIAARDVDKKNTFIFNFNISGKFSEEAAFISSVVAAETFAVQKIPLISDVGRIFCDANQLTDKSDPSLYPAKAHRIIEVFLNTTTTKAAPFWPQITGSIYINSAVFGEKKEDILKIDKEERFEPEALSRKIAAAITGKTHDLAAQKFSILKREGRFVYLNRGKAFGLEIGMHLVGPGAKLHIIQFAPKENDYDVSVALIRSEDSARPLKSGDEIVLDETKYPAGEPSFGKEIREIPAGK